MRLAKKANGSKPMNARYQRIATAATIADQLKYPMLVDILWDLVEVIVVVVLICGNYGCRNRGRAYCR